MAIQKTRRRTPFNLPTPWTPNRVLPENVIDEGLERRTLVTQQQQDGTFDNPHVGNAGRYAIPEYINRERYGRGAFVTKWAQRGTYYGPQLNDWLSYPVAVVEDVQRLPRGRVGYTMESLSGDEPLPQAYENYGQKAAQLLLDHARSHPPQQRKAALKKILDKVDRSLWSRTATIAKRYESQGVPPPIALRNGLARAMGAGVLAEVIKTGMSGRPPTPTGQLGLGCYGRTRNGSMTALGDVGASKAGTTMISGLFGTVANTCNPPPGFTWIGDHWERARVGVAPIPGPGTDCYVIDTRTGLPGSRTPPRVATPVGPLLQIGGVDTFRFSPAGGCVTYHGVGGGRPDQALVDAVTAATNADPFMLRASSTGNGRPFTASDFGLDRSLGFPPAMVILPGIALGNIPVIKFKHPENGEDWGMYIEAIANDGTAGTSIARSQIPGMSACYIRHVSPFYPMGVEGCTGIPAAFSSSSGANLCVHKVPIRNGGFWNGLWQLLPSSIATIIHSVVDALGGLACELVNSPIASTGAVVAAGAMGVPPVAGAAGVSLAQQACGQPAPPPAPPIASSSSLVPVAIVGAVVIGAALLLTKKKRK